MKSFRSNKGAVEWGVVILLSAVLMVVGVKWKPLDMFRSPPDTGALIKAQTERDLANAKAEQAVREKDAGIKAEREKNDAQGKVIQESNALALAAAQSVPPDKATAETNLTLEMVQRTDLQLAVQLGALPKDIRDGLTLSISKALNGQRAEFDKAIMANDALFKAITAQRDEMATQIPILEQKAVKALETAKASQLDADSKADTIAKQALALDAKVRSESSLSGALSSTWTDLKIAGVIVVILAGLALYLKRGLGSVGSALHPLQKVLTPEDYTKVVASLDANTDSLHQWLISLGRKAEAKAASIAAQAHL